MLRPSDLALQQDRITAKWKTSEAGRGTITRVVRREKACREAA
jgi:hypothetical protein